MRLSTLSLYLVRGGFLGMSKKLCHQKKFFIMETVDEGLRFCLVENKAKIVEKE